MIEHELDTVIKALVADADWLVKTFAAERPKIGPDTNAALVELLKTAGRLRLEYNDDVVIRD